MGARAQRDAFGVPDPSWEHDGQRAEWLLDAIRNLQAQALEGRDPRDVRRELLRIACRAFETSDGFLSAVDRGSRPTRLTVQALQGSFSSEAETAPHGRRLPLRFRVPEGGGALSRALELGEPIRWSAADECGHGLPIELSGRDVLWIVPVPGARGPLALLVLRGNGSARDRANVARLEPLLSDCAGVLDHLEARLQRERTERALVRSERTLQTLMGNLPGMVYRCDADGARTLHFVSGGSREIFGVAPELLLGRGDGGLTRKVLENDRSGVLDGVRAALEAREPFELHYRVRDEAGEVRWVWDRGQGVRNDAGELEFVEGFLTDVTASKRAEEERLRLEAQVQQSHKLESLALLAGGIAHDLNNALLGVLGHAGLASRQIAPDHPAGHALEEVESSALRAARLAEQMLSFSGGGPIREQELDLNACVRNARHALERALPHGVRLELELADRLPPVAGDAAHVREALVHLVRNAGEALTERGAGVVRVSTGALELDRARPAGEAVGEPAGPGGHVVLAVSDDGPGMDRRTRARAFDPFFTTKGLGRGLGLSAVLGVARSHGAAVELASSSGSGTTVRLALPAAARQDEVLVPTPAPSEARAKGTGTILVVDDEEVVRCVASALLTESGYSVLTAKDGREGVDVFAEHADEIRAVLLDLSMPRLGGEQALIEMRKLRPDARILLTSGYAEDDAMHRIAARQGVGFLKKPYRLDELSQRLDEVLGDESATPARSGSPRG